MEQFYKDMSMFKITTHKSFLRMIKKYDDLPGWNKIANTVIRYKGSQKDLQFFPTSLECDKLMKALQKGFDIGKDDAIYEPTAGLGHLVYQLLKNVNVDICANQLKHDIYEIMNRM